MKKQAMVMWIKRNKRTGSKAKMQVLIVAGRLFGGACRVKTDGVPPFFGYEHVKGD